MGAPEEQPTRSLRALRPHPESNTIMFVISGPIARTGIDNLCERVRLLLEGCEADQVDCDVSELVAPDAVTVDALARLQLTARRLGFQIRLLRACGELQDLLDLMGLGDALPLTAGLPVEPRGQAKQREQGLGVEEEADPADPLA